MLRLRRVLVLDSRLSTSDGPDVAASSPSERVYGLTDPDAPGGDPSCSAGPVVVVRRGRVGRGGDSAWRAFCYVVAVHARAHPWRTLAFFCAGGLLWSGPFSDVYGAGFIAVHLVAVTVAHRDDWPGYRGLADGPGLRPGRGRRSVGVDGDRSRGGRVV